MVKDDIKTFPQFYCPEGVVAWARKDREDNITFTPTQVPEDDWNPSLPVDWREQQTRMAQEYERGIAHAREGVEPV